jgi:hypothetical protein
VEPRTLDLNKEIRLNLTVAEIEAFLKAEAAEPATAALLANVLAEFEAVAEAATPNPILREAEKLGFALVRRVLANYAGVPVPAPGSPPAG